MDAEQSFKEMIDLQDANSVDKIAQMLLDLKTTMAELKPAIDAAKAQKEEFNSQIKAHRDEIQKLSEASHEIDVAVFDTQRKMREIEREMQRQERLLVQAAENKRQAEEYARLSDEFDKMTAGAPWREFAFDHQISGAKKLAVQKRAILADKRGLGKSLTSLIYADMVGAKKILAVVPNDTVDNYIREIKHWAPHRKVVKLAGLPKAQRDFLLSTLVNIDEFMLVVNYEAWRRDKELLANLNNLQLDTLIADESHNIKDRKTIAYRGLKEITQSNNCCSKCGSANVYADLDNSNYSGRF